MVEHSAARPSVGWPEANESRRKKYRLNETAYIVESDRKQRASGHIVNGCRLAIQPIAYSKDMPCVLRLLEHQRNELDQFAQSNV